MANIDTELQTIATAIYGRDMRGAIHDSIAKVNNDIGGMISKGITFTSSGGDFGGTGLIEKTGSIVTFQFNLHITTGFGGETKTLFTVPAAYKPNDNANTRMFPIWPCPYDDSGQSDAPYITLEKDGSDWVFKVYHLDNGWVSDFYCSGVYSVATPAST